MPASPSVGTLFAERWTPIDLAFPAGVLRANESESPLEQESARPAIIHAVDTPAASEERSKFQRTVGRWDTTFLMLAAIIVLDTLGAVSSYGAQSFTWLRPSWESTYASGPLTGPSCIQRTNCSSAAAPPK